MALKYYADSPHTIYGQPGTIPRSTVDRGKEVGNMMVYRKLDLAASAYVTGGFPLLPDVTRMKAVFNCIQLAGYDPFDKPIQGNGYQAVLVKTTPDGMHSKLMLYVNGAEVGNGSTASAGNYLWVAFIGAG